LEVFFQHGTAVLSAAFSPDGQTILTGDDNRAQLWEVATGRPVGPPCRHMGIAYPHLDHIFLPQRAASRQ
jgi:WD40 repeat protein